MKKIYNSLEKLSSVLLELRQKCPWDKKQTIESLRHLTIEEVYELSEAILSNDYDLIKEELGDILLHILFYSLISNENNKFSLVDVIDSQVEKLIKRHPHIYDDLDVKNINDVKKNWELIKLKENKNKTVLSGVPKSLPTLLKTYRVIEKVRGIGFDFESRIDCLEKVIEELNEFNNELNKNDKDKMNEEFGDLLFSIICYGQKLGINSVDSLDYTNKKFIKKFNKLEKNLHENKLTFSNVKPSYLKTLWSQIEN